MMRTVFQTSPFGRNSITVERTGWRPVAGLGQGEDLLDSFGGLAEELDELSDNLLDLIDEVPVGSVKKEFETRRDECMTKSTFSKYNCLYDLFQDIKAHLKGQGAALPPPKTPTKKPEPSTFPYIPVAIGSVALVALIYVIAKG